jgi:hypothetical protein
VSTTAAFFVGEGDTAIFVGGQFSDGYVQENGQLRGVPASLLQATTEEDFRRCVAQHMKTVGAAERMAERMTEPLSWATAKGVQYIYCFFEGHVWVTNGGRWYNNYISADAKPSKTVPSSPICRIGGLDIDIAVTCGECGRREKLIRGESEKRFPNWWSIDDIFTYFEFRGWRKNAEQGWLCDNCAR